MLRSVAAVLSGLVVFSVFLLAGQATAGALVQELWPEAAASGPVMMISVTAMLLWIAWETLSMAGGGYIAACVASRLGVRHAVIMGAIQALMTIWAMFAVRQDGEPLWFWLLDITLMIPAAWAGGRIRVASVGQHV